MTILRCCHSSDNVLLTRIDQLTSFTVVCAPSTFRTVTLQLLLLNLFPSVTFFGFLVCWLDWTAGNYPLIDQFPRG